MIWMTEWNHVSRTNIFADTNFLRIKILNLIWFALFSYLIQKYQLVLFMVFSENFIQFLSYGYSFFYHKFRLSFPGMMIFLLRHETCYIQLV